MAGSGGVYFPGLDFYPQGIYDNSTYASDLFQHKHELTSFKLATAQHGDFIRSEISLFAGPGPVIGGTGLNIPGLENYPYGKFHQTTNLYKNCPSKHCVTGY